MSEWRKIWPNGLPDEDRSPKSGHRMAAEGMPFSWRWNGGTTTMKLDVIWGMSAKEGVSSMGWDFVRSAALVNGFAHERIGDG